MTIKNENSELSCNVVADFQLDCPVGMDNKQTEIPPSEENCTSNPESHFIDSGSETETNNFERSFWLCNRRSFIRRSAIHQSLRRYSTRSHDCCAIKRTCKVKPITDNKSKELEKQTEWKLNIDDFRKKKQPNENIKAFPKPLRSFYKGQDNLISSYEELSSDKTYEEDTDPQRSAEFYAKLTFYANLFLLAAKTTASILSGSIAIISSLVDSIVDLASGIVIWITSKSVKNCDRHKFPNGRKTFEPLAIIILSVIMALASLQLVNEATHKIIGLANNTKFPPTVDYVTIGIASVTVVVKLILYLICRKIPSPTVKALAQDHRNDVVSNTLAIVCGYLGSKEFRQETQLYFMSYVDPVGAILICLYIAVTWCMTGKAQAKILTGLTADPGFISKVTWLCLNHHHRVIYVKSVKAYHSGYNFITEVDIVLSDDLSFKESRDITESLQEKIEKLPEVERVYVSPHYELYKKKMVEIQLC